MHIKAMAGAALLLGTLVFSSLDIAAQSTTDGAIAATLYDPAGNVVQGAKVSIQNEATNAVISVTTDTSGFFRAPHLQPGHYQVSITSQGFAPYVANDVVVEVGVLTALNPPPHLAVGGTEQTVTVSDETPLVNTTSPEVASVLNQTDIDNLPINGGRWSDFSLLTPGVVSDSTGYGLLSFRGISTLLNNNTIDGADNNQAYFSEERGRTRAGYSTAQASILEYQVNTSNYSAEYGRAAGGVVNVVTKSGSNQLHGEFYFNDRDNDWGALNGYTTLTTQTSPGVFTTAVYNPKDWRKIWGFGLGGPLVRDKLFFFYAYDQYRRNFPATAKVGNANAFFATPDAALPTGKICGGTGTAAPSTLDAQICILQTRLGYATYSHSASQYDAALNALATGDLGQVPRTGNQVINFPKLDWQINSRNHASIEYNRFRWDSPGGIQQTVSGSLGANSYGNDFVKIDWGVARLLTILTPEMTNEARYQYGRELDDEFGDRPNAYEAPIASTAFGVTPRVTLDGSTGLYFGNPIYLDRKAYPDERRNQFADTVNWQRGNHAIKFGVDYNHVNDLSINLQYQKGQYTYPAIYNYVTDYYEALSGNPKGTCNSAQNGVGTLPCYSSFVQGFGPLTYDFSTNDYDFFFQDDWKVLPRLSVSLGLRYEYEQLPNSPGGPSISLGSNTVQAGFMPSDKNNIGPRVGFSWDMFGSGKTVLRGGYGIFNGRLINSTIFQAYAFNGTATSQTSYTYNNNTANAPLFPQVFASTPTGTGAAPSVDYFDHNFQLPQVHQMDLTLQQDIGWKTVIGVSYMGSMARELPGFVDANINTAAATTKTFTVVGGGPLNVSTFTTPFYTSRINSSYSHITDIFSGINSNYQAMAAQISHRLNHHLQFYAGYTWSHALDYNQNQSTFSDTNDQYDPRSVSYDYGNSIYDIPNRLVADAVYEVPGKHSGWMHYVADGFLISPLFQMQDGLPYSAGTSGTPSGALYGSVNGSGGNAVIGGKGLPGVGRNTYRLPNTYVADLRLSKSFILKEKYGLELMGEAFNVANHTNVTQQNTTAYTISGSTLTYNSVFGTDQNANSNYTYTPRQMELSARFKF